LGVEGCQPAKDAPQTIFRNPTQVASQGTIGGAGVESRRDCLEKGMNFRGWPLKNRRLAERLLWGRIFRDPGWGGGVLGVGEGEKK